MGGRFGTFGKFIDDGDGNMLGREGCGACMGDCGGMKIEPDEEAVWCGELAMGVVSAP